MGPREKGSSIRKHLTESIALKDRTLNCSTDREEKKKMKAIYNRVLNVRMDSHSWPHKREQICQREQLTD